MITTLRTVLRERLDLLVLLGCQALFLFAPGLDLWAAGLFHSAEHGFFLASHPLVLLPYEVFKVGHLVIGLGLIGLLWASWHWRRRAEQVLRARLWFLLLVLLVGPGLLVNAVLKAESGRARPHQVEPFGGPRDFTPVFTPADQCERNCSFVSGHASMGFWFIALAWVLRDRRWLWAGIALGAYVGLGRMAQGGHFFSDVVFAYWVVYAVCVVLARWLLHQDRIADTG